MHLGKQKDPALGLALWVAHGKVCFDPSAPEVHAKGLFDMNTAELYFLWASAANEKLWGNGSLGTRKGTQIQMYLNLWLS